MYRIERLTPVGAALLVAASKGADGSARRLAPSRQPTKLATRLPGLACRSRDEAQSASITSIMAPDANAPAIPNKRRAHHKRGT
jgi:hypothetical protein